MLIQPIGGDGRLWQWDIDREVEISVTEQYTINQIRIGKSGDQITFKKDLEQPASKITLVIPNNLLTDTRNIVFFAVVEDYEQTQTVDTGFCPVKKQIKPEHYVFEEQERLTWEKLQQDIDDLKTYVDLKFEVLGDNTTAEIDAKLQKQEDELKEYINKFDHAVECVEELPEPTSEVVSKIYITEKRAYLGTKGVKF